jgi:alcohol dehydrogenase
VVEAALAATGLLDLGKIVVTTFKLAEFKQAVEAAALIQGLDLTAVRAVTPPVTDQH